MMAFRAGRQSGFTLVELIATMIIVAVLAYNVLPRFDVVGSFDAAGFTDQTKSLFRFGQRSAIAQRRWVAVDVGANPPTICSQTYVEFPVAVFPTCAANCAGGSNVTPIGLPGGQARAPMASTTLAGASVMCFDAEGRPFANGAVVPLGVAATLSISDAGTLFRTITIEAETGYVR